MRYPTWVDDLPMVNTSFPGASGRMVDGVAAEAVLWHFPDGGSVPVHTHGPQIGVVISGCVRLSIDGDARDWRPGEMFTIGDGVPHSATLDPDTLVVEIFEGTGRHQTEST